MTVEREVDRSARAAIIDKVITTVEKKHYDPKFDKDQFTRKAVDAK